MAHDAVFMSHVKQSHAIMPCSRIRVNSYGVEHCILLTVSVKRLAI